MSKNNKNRRAKKKYIYIYINSTIPFHFLCSQNFIHFRILFYFISFFFLFVVVGGAVSGSQPGTRRSTGIWKLEREKQNKKNTM